MHAPFASSLLPMNPAAGSPRPSHPKVRKPQYICRTKLLGLRTMKRPKDETLSIRTSADIKQLLKLAAEREHRSVASMVEVLVLTYAEQHAFPEQIVNAIPTLTNAVANSRNGFSESHFAEDSHRWLAIFARDMTNSIGRLLLHFI